MLSFSFSNLHELFEETLINYLREMKRKAHGAQKPRHIKRIVEVASTAQRSDSLAQVINQRFLRDTQPASFIKYRAENMTLLLRNDWEFFIFWLNVSGKDYPAQLLDDARRYDQP